MLLLNSVQRVRAGVRWMMRSTLPLRSVYCFLADGTLGAGWRGGGRWFTLRGVPGPGQAGKGNKKTELGAWCWGPDCIEVLLGVSAVGTNRKGMQ